jgi:hypothetical protein
VNQIHPIIHPNLTARFESYEAGSRLRLG